MTFDLPFPRPLARQLLPAWLSLLLVPLVTAAALDAGPDEPLRRLGIGVLCAAIMLGQVLVALELSTAARREALLAAQARVDPLTGLGNRRALEEALRAEAHRARRTGRPAAVLVLDLDGFKAVNDQRGHEAGDALLQAFAAVIAARTRGGVDTACRPGGDEFVVVMPEAGIEEATAVAHRIRAGLHPVAARLAPGLDVGCSAGVAELDEPGLRGDPEAWLALADRRMYAAKGRGR